MNGLLEQGEGDGGFGGCTVILCRIPVISVLFRNRLYSIEGVG